MTDQVLDQKLDTQSYEVRDSYFGQPYIDRDEYREKPYPHRNVHGGFENTDTRFTFYFPAKEEWGGRMYHPLEGAHAGHEEAFAGAMGELLGGLEMMVGLGGYMVESNSGHIGDDIDPRAGVDPGLYGYRASVESARFSKYVARQIYGREPDYSYVWGGSGGGRRSPLCLEYCGGVYDGALPFMGGGNVEPHGTNSRVRSEQPVHFGAMFNVQRLLRGEKLERVIDAMQPGGSGNPFDGLSVHEREELANLYRLGYPRGDEFMIAKPMGQIWLWTSIAGMLLEEDAEYFHNFWSEPGYIGHDERQWIEHDLIDAQARITRIITVQDMIGEEFSGPEFADAKPMAVMRASSTGEWDLPIGIEVDGLSGGYRQGAGVRIETGDIAGRQLYCMQNVGNMFFCDGRAEANLERFRGAKAGDLVHIDNHAFLAFCYMYRYHLSNDALNDFLPAKQVQKLLEEKRIEIAPLAFMRGRTLSNAFVVLDEAQNATTMQMKMFLTRLGEGSRMVITGDRTQVDLPRGVPSGLQEAERILNGVKGVSFNYFSSKDVVRHPLVARVIEAYERDEAKSS